MKNIILLVGLLGAVSCAKARLESVVGADDQDIKKVAPPPAPVQNIFPPTADVEVVDPVTNRSVSAVLAGKEYIIQPTVDTMDTDLVPAATSNPDCRNPGISRVELDVVPKEAAIEPLGRVDCATGMATYRHIFKTPGIAKISMTVRTDETGESAAATASIEVLETNQFVGEDWFDLTGTPLYLPLKSDNTTGPITFNAYCLSRGTGGYVEVHPEPGVNLTLTGGSSQVSHSFTKPGIYKVRGFCMNSLREVRESTVTVVVLPEDGSGVKPGTVFTGDNFDENNFTGGQNQNSPGQNGTIQK